MISVRDDFDERVTEIENYFRFVQNLVEERFEILPNTARGGIALTLNEEDLLIKTLKANCFLLLYNLVEATTKNAIQAIFDEFKSRGITYDQCTQEVRRIAIKNLKREKLGIDQIYPRLTIVAQHIMTEPFDKDALLAGNVDALALKSLAKEYGFSEPTQRCDKFKDVRENRNYLAHGNKTFKEIGRDYTIQDLEVITNQIKVFLSAFVDSVDDYLINQHYLLTYSATNTPTAVT